MENIGIEPMKINILGIEYTLTSMHSSKDAKLYGKDGYTDFTSKKIVIREDMADNSPDDSENIDLYVNYVIRHEIAHAFLYESGLAEMSNDEMLVDWIALQFPKIESVYSYVAVLV